MRVCTCVLMFLCVCVWLPFVCIYIYIFGYVHYLNYENRTIHSINTHAFCVTFHGILQCSAAVSYLGLPHRVSPVFKKRLHHLQLTVSRSDMQCSFSILETPIHSHCQHAEMETACDWSTFNLTL